MSTPEEIQANRARATKAAMAGDARAADWLGTSYRRDEPRDTCQARHWTRVAAERGHPGAMVRHAKHLHARGEDTLEARRWLGLLTDLGHMESRYLLSVNLARQEPVDLEGARSVARNPELRGRQRTLLHLITDIDWRRAAGPVLGTERSTVKKPYVTLTGWLWNTDVTVGDGTSPLSVEHQSAPHLESPPMWTQLLDQGWLVALLREEQHGPCGLSHERFLEVPFDPWNPHMDEIVATIRDWCDSFAQ